MWLFHMSDAKILVNSNKTHWKLVISRRFENRTRFLIIDSKILSGALFSFYTNRRALNSRSFSKIRTSYRRRKTLPYIMLKWIAYSSFSKQWTHKSCSLSLLCVAFVNLKNKLIDDLPWFCLTKCDLQFESGTIKKTYLPPPILFQGTRVL